MTNREQYAPGPAAGAEIRKDGEQWTLVFVRDLAAIGTAKLSTVGAPTLHVTETQVKRADAPRVLEFNWGDRTSAGSWMCWIVPSPVSPSDASSAPRA